MRTPKASNDQNKEPLLEVQMEQSKKQIKTKFTGVETLLELQKSDLNLITRHGDVN